MVTNEVLFTVFSLAILIDFVTGVLVAAKGGRLKSRTCSDGMFRSIGECIVLGIFMLAAYYVPQASSLISMFMIGFLFKEGLSICENLIGLDVWLPTSLISALEVGVNKIDKGETK